MKKIKLLGVIILLTGKGFAQESGKLLIGDVAPEFRIAYWLKGDPGKGVEPGKVSIVEFWATWCAPCIGNFPHLSKIADDYKSKDVSVFGISVWERKGVGVDSLKKFVEGRKGKNMRYIVGADDTTKYMSTAWIQATGQRGIPFAMIVDKNGKIAWMGHPSVMDKPLEKIVSGKWGLKEERAKFIEDKRLDSIDGSIITEFNKYTKPENAAYGLLALDSLLKKEPGLKYRQFTAHYTFVYGLNTNPEKAVSFAREAWKVSEIPAWFRVSDMVLYTVDKKLKMPESVYLLAIDALQEQIDNYPWAMENAATYDKLATLFFYANNRQKAAENEKKALAMAKEDPKITEKLIAEYQGKLKSYENK